MDYTFSQRIRSLKPSAIREILKAASTPGMIPFAAGNPAAEVFPTQLVEHLTQEILQTQPVTALQYGVSEGYEPLRQLLRKTLQAEQGIGRETDDLLITAGAQQVMDLAAKVLCNEGDTILCESPSFIGSLNCFRSYNANLVGIDMQPDGIDLAQLEHALQTQKNVCFLYVIPNFQNPTGITMSLEKRRAVYALAKQYGILILEDNPYGELRVRGENIPSIKSMDEDGIVLYAGSFSKILAPGLRVGYALAPAGLIAKMTVGKQTSDVHSPMLCQMLAHLWMQRKDADYFDFLRGVYRRKMDVMCDLLDSRLGDFFQYQKPQGGLFVWCALPEGVDMLSYCKLTLEHMVAVVPGTAFLTDEKQSSRHIRLNFSTPPDERIIAGMEILEKLKERF